MATVKAGDTIPEGTFSYVPYSPETESQAACGIPVNLKTSEWIGKKVVLIAVPGAFTPTCHANHLPPFIEKYDEFKAKGVDVIAVVATNDAFVMSGWGKTFGIKDKILMLSDVDAKWSSGMGLSKEIPGMIRLSRYAMVIDDLKVKSIEVEPAKGVTVSGADAVLAKL